ncbi:MAG: AAA-like domain-containing protein [Rivularia sp. (in: Bacteria)]|nr:AAA-like domain-containing protein [Rivularia sp. MS3]
MTASNSNFYQVGASLQVNAPSYVRRQADEEFYQKLQAGKFCYVLNSRQMGKSSLRVQTMQQLQAQGNVCAAIDLTGIGKVTQEQWYAGIVYNLSESCQLEDNFDFDWQEWWGKHQVILSPVQCLGLFIEKVLLEKIQSPIVIFVDEIDKVLSQDFSLDDFFALIRFFQNQRVDNPIFERLTFALLGVATPGDLIKNKSQTPFNIGEAIELHGFTIDEVEPLIRGLEGRFNHPQEVMTEILDWTGGQPFLTQKLCKFMVEESQKDYPRSVEEVIKSRIIENWESQDDPEHLRTIRNRILASEQRAGYLLELYQQIQQQGEVAASNSLDKSELKLSGLVVQREGKLITYNQIYQEVFNQNWVEIQLNNLRPYSEAFRVWVASEYSDKSRLLQGKALEDAEEWAKDKDLSFQDKQFLAASREKEIQEKIAAEEKEAQLEREKKNKEAAEQRNQVLSEANVKAKRRIRNGTVVLILALLGTVGLGVFAAIEGNKAFQAQEMFKEANKKAEKANQKTEEERKNVVALQQQTKELQTDANNARKEAQEAEAKANNANQKAVAAIEKAKVEQEKANNANQKAIAAIEKAQQAQKNADDANQKVTEARKQTETEQQKAQQAQKKANDANRKAIEAGEQAKAEQQKAETAKQQAKQAQKKADEAIRKAENLQNQLASAKKDIENVQALSKLAGELRNKDTFYSDKALRQAGLSFRVNEHHLKQAMLLAAMSQAYQNLKQPKEAEAKMNESLKYLNNKGKKISSAKGLQIKVLVKANEGELLADKSKQQAINAYKEAYKILKNHPNETNPFQKNQILTDEDVESVYRELLNLQPNRNQQVWQSLKEHFYARLENSLRLKNWGAADSHTSDLMEFIADREQEEIALITHRQIEGERYLLKTSQLEKFCPDLKRMDKLWVKNSRSNFGFSVQKEIWGKTGDRLDIKLTNLQWNRNDRLNYSRFASTIGYDTNSGYPRPDLQSISKDPFNPRLRGRLPSPLVIAYRNMYTDGSVVGMNYIRVRKFKVVELWLILFSRCEL